MPKVSVLIPLYKTETSHLREAIQSILDQSFGDFELLLLDDCPEDDRSAVVATFNDPRIRYEKNEKNLGISPSRNKLIDMAQGEYLAIMDHDDISLPDRLEKQVAYLEAHPEVGVVSGRQKIMGTRKCSCYPEQDADIRLSLMSGCALTHSASMLRKSLLTSTGIRYNAHYTPSEDYALWCELMPHTQFHNLQEVILHYRSHASNVSHRQKERMNTARAAIWAKVRTQNPELYAEFRQRASHTTRIKLFCVIPFLKIVTCDDRQRGYLFGKLPLWQKRVDVKY